MKKFIKKLFVPLFSSTPVSFLATSVFGRGIPIFMVHRIAEEGQEITGTTPDHLRNCLQYLTENGYTFVSLEEVIHSLGNRATLPEKAVVFTMDDGFSDQGRIAAPIFLEYDCPLTFFVITGLVDQSLWPWDAQVSWIIDNTSKHQLSVNIDNELVEVAPGDSDLRSQARSAIRNIIKEVDPVRIPGILNQLAETAGVILPEHAPADFQPLDWKTARNLESKGIRFAPHSITHRILSKLNRESAKQEITGSWETLNRELARPLKVFCYPTGRILDFGPREINILKEEGFLGAVSTAVGYVEPENEPDKQVFRLPRLELPDNMTDFIQYCSWIERAKWSN